MRVHTDGVRTHHNPLIIITPEDVQEWVRSKCDELGFSDRALLAIQITVQHPFEGGMTHHHETPQLVAMVSNIPNSRKKKIIPRSLPIWSGAEYLLDGKQIGRIERDTKRGEFTAFFGNTKLVTTASAYTARKAVKEKWDATLASLEEALR